MLCSFKLQQILAEKEDTHFCGCNIPRPLSSPKVNKVILHIHGGGFISMSSYSHQSYTRIWANELNIPIFSVDYRKAPQYPFPAGLDDVWQVYTWIVNHAEQHLGIIPKKIILVGDSAGGNLILAVTLKAIMMNFPLPCGLLAYYPALDLTRERFTESLLLSLEDPILSHTYLKICLDSYLKDTKCDPRTHPLISPLNASDELLERMPPIRLFTGTVDPLHDDTLRFADRLLENGVDTKLFIYPGIYHGSLSFAVKGGVKACRQSVNDGIEMFKELFDLEPKHNTSPTLGAIAASLI